MNFDELKESFQSLDHELEDGTSDIEKIQQKIAKSRRTINFRDIREIVACVVVFVLFAPAVFARFTMMTRLGAGVSCAAALFIGIWLYLGNRRHRPRPERSVDEFLAAEIAHLDYQIWLLRNVSWWYLAPLAIGFLMFVWGMAPAPMALAMSVGYYLLDRFINWLNQYATDNDLIPRRNELQQVRDSLNNPSIQSSPFTSDDSDSFQ